MSTASYDFSHTHDKAPEFGRLLKKILSHLWQGYVRSQTKRAQSYIALYGPRA